MTEYQAHVVGIDGRFIRFTDFLCDDDVAQAENVVIDHRIELWSGPRMIVRLPE